METRKKFTIDDLNKAMEGILGRYENLNQLKFEKEIPQMISLEWIVIIRPFLVKNMSLIGEPESLYLKLRYKLYSRGLNTILYIFYGVIPIGKMNINRYTSIEKVATDDEICSMINLPNL